jgi:ribokinase
MYNVITIGSSLVDLFVSSADFKLRQENDQLFLCELYGDKIEVDQFSVTTGGGGSNTAIGFTRLGFRSSVISELGTDAWSQVIVDGLEQEQVDTSLLIKEKKEQTGGSVILLSPDGGRTVMAYRGAASMLEPRDIPDYALTQTEWVHLSSISGQLDTLQKIFSLLTEHKKRFSWNPGKAEIRLLISGELQVGGLDCMAFQVNQEEWQQLTPVHQRIHTLARQVVVTQGRAGGTVYEAGQVVHQYTVAPAQAVDETGAGDSFCVGYVAGLMSGKTVQECAEFGKRNAASVVQFIGATKGLLTSDQLP